MDMNAFLEQVVDKPSVFFVPSEDVAQQVRAVVKTTFDATKPSDLKKASLPLPELYVDGFDSDQIWAELELQHRPLLKFVDRAVKKLLKNPHKVTLPLPVDSDSSEEEEEEDEEEEDVDGVASAQSEAEEDAPAVGSSDDEGVPSDRDVEMSDASDAEAEQDGGNADNSQSGVDNEFFSLEEMEKFVDEAGDEALGEEFDLLQPDVVAGDSNDPYSGPTYADMFGSGDEGEGGAGSGEDDGEDEGAGSDASFPEELDAGFGSAGRESGKTNSEDEDSVDESMLTPFQLQQRKLQESIKELEAEALQPRSWELTGEVRKDQRPENSLLETVLEYDQAQPAAPEVTAESTAALEDVIKQRIRDEIWDDVERKVAEPLKRAIELPDVSMEQSKLGLGEIYEKEYMKQAMNVAEPDEKQLLRDEIKGLFAELCGRLDALSNFNFTPKPVVPELNVKPNVAAITMEEVIPTAVSDAKLQAPEEVYRKKRGREGVLVGTDELTREEKKRRRRARKAAKSKRHRQAEKARKLVAKINPGLGNKYAKEQMLKELGAAKNVTKTTADAAGGDNFKSTKFFTALQSQVQREVQGFKESKGLVSKPTAGGAASLKL